MKNNTTWKNTDPDSYQYGRKISEGVYNFKEFDRHNYSTNNSNYLSVDEYMQSIFDNDEFWIEIKITMKHYSQSQIEDYTSAYYTSIEQIKEIYGDSYEWIIAECIFEQESGLY